MIARLRPCADLCRTGPDGIDVYDEEMKRLDKLGIQWTGVEMIRNDMGEALGGRIHVDGTLKPIQIFGFTDEAP